VTGQHVANLLFGGIRILAKKLGRRYQDAGRAEAALEGMMPAE
jgi:hypothetical protein